MLPGRFRFLLRLQNSCGLGVGLEPLVLTEEDDRVTHLDGLKDRRHRVDGDIDAAVAAAVDVKVLAEVRPPRRVMQAVRAVDPNPVF